jgi:hypothetical protein
MDEKPDFYITGPIDVGAYADRLGRAKDATLNRRLRAFIGYGLVGTFIVATLAAIVLVFLNAAGVTHAPDGVVISFMSATLGADVLSGAILVVVKNLFP